MVNKLKRKKEEINGRVLAVLTKEQDMKGTCIWIVLGCRLGIALEPLKPIYGYIYIYALV